MIRAVLDADVLYPLPLRDTLLSAAEEGCFQPVWSAEILDEAIRNLLADNRIRPAGATALRQALDQHFEDALTRVPEPLIARRMNHPKDRHVTACAVAGGASLIVTSNVRDFAVLPDTVVAVSPDDFLLRLMSGSPDLLNRALMAQAARLKRKPMDVLAILKLLELVAPKFVAAWLSAA